MGRLETKRTQASRRQSKVRSRIIGTKTKPRLSVNVTNKHILAQLIDDESSHTIAYVSSAASKTKGTKTDRAKWVGEQIAASAAKAGVKTAVVDRRSSLYHGRVKALADAARDKGLEL